MIDDILKEYQELCRTDITNRKRLIHYNRIQCYIMAGSGLECSVWVTLYAEKYAALVDYVDDIEELEKLLYR